MEAALGVAAYAKLLYDAGYGSADAWCEAVPLTVPVVGNDRQQPLPFGLRRNNESPTLPSGFNYCAKGLGAGVFTQPEPEGDFQPSERSGIWHYHECLALPM